MSASKYMKNHIQYIDIFPHNMQNQTMNYITEKLNFFLKKIELDIKLLLTSFMINKIR